jgi:hypothetical protein
MPPKQAKPKSHVNKYINLLETKPQKLPVNYLKKKNTFDIDIRKKLYESSFNSLKYRIIIEHEKTLIHKIDNFIQSNNDLNFQAKKNEIKNGIYTIFKDFKRDMNKITYQLDFVNSFNKYSQVTIDNIKEKYIKLLSDLLFKNKNTKVESVIEHISDEILNDFLNKNKKYLNPFKLLLDNESEKLSEFNSESDFIKGFILHKNVIHKDNNEYSKGRFPYKDIENFASTSYLYDGNKQFSFYTTVFKIASYLTYYVIQKYNHHFLLAYFFIYNVTEILSSNEKRNLEIISEQYNNNILQKLSQTIEEEKQKNIIIQCVLSIFSFHQYAKHYHNNTGDINQAFVYNETKPPEGKKRHVKYILDDKVFYLEDMGYIVYIWGFNQGKEQIEEIGTPDKQKILNEYLNFFNALSLQSLLSKTDIQTKLSFNNSELQDITDPKMFEVKLVNIILGLLEYTIDSTNKPQDAEIINKDNPCYLTKPSDVEFCFAVNATSGDISSVDSTKITYNDNTLNINSETYATSDKPEHKIKKYTNDNTTIYLIKNKNVPSLHIAYIISDNDISIKKQIEYENSEIKRIFDVYLSDLYDLTKFLTE